MKDQTGDNQAKQGGQHSQPGEALLVRLVVHRANGFVELRKPKDSRSKIKQLSIERTPNQLKAFTRGSETPSV